MGKREIFIMGTTKKNPSNVMDKLVQQRVLTPKKIWCCGGPPKKLFFPSNGMDKLVPLRVLTPQKYGGRGLVFSGLSPCPN